MNAIWKAWIFAVVVVCLVSVCCSYVRAEEDDFAGLDEKVVNKVAEVMGHPARDPIINTDRGDLLLFVFTLAGASAGFIAGYNWRKVFGNADCGHQGASSRLRIDGCNSPDTKA